MLHQFFFLLSFSSYLFVARVNEYYFSFNLHHYSQNMRAHRQNVHLKLFEISTTSMSLSFQTRFHLHSPAPPLTFNPQNHKYPIKNAISKNGSPTKQLTIPFGPPLPQLVNVSSLSTKRFYVRRGYIHPCYVDVGC